MSYDLMDDGIVWYNSLNLHDSQEVVVILTHGTTDKFTLKSSGLAQIEKTDDYQVLYIPAMPDKGFNFPFMLNGKTSSIRPSGKKYLI